MQNLTQDRCIPVPGRSRWSLAVVTARAPDRLAAAPVSVEVHLANGLPLFTILGP